ncbi:MAG: hypothetical protein IJJ25_00790 [Lachnospiraceae bacterium]|nr:hypothetical protein [Lachnospiraceae bacterium]
MIREIQPEDYAAVAGFWRDYLDVPAAPPQASSAQARRPCYPKWDMKNPLSGSIKNSNDGRRRENERVGTYG